MKINTPILLFLPNTRWFDKRPWLLVPHSALILTALLKKNFDFHLLDANAENLSLEDASIRIKEINPSVFLVSGVSVEYFQQYHASFELLKKVLPKCVTVFGGIYPTIMPKESLLDKNIDFIFLGTAEGRCFDFMKSITTQDYLSVKKQQGVGYRDKNGLPVINLPIPSNIVEMAKIKPDYSMLDVETYIKQSSKEYNWNFPDATGVLLTSYGCRYNCVFCATRTIRGKGIAFRSARDVINEIDYLIEHHGIRHLSFLDECFLDDRKRTLILLKAIKARKLTWKMPNVSAWHLDEKLLEKMKDSGCQLLTISVESGSERVLKNIIKKPVRLEMFLPIVKKCKELGISVAANFVIGLPGETWSDIRQTFEFAEKIDFDLCSFHIATPYPGTDLYRIALAEKLLPSDFDFRNPKYFGTSYGFITTDEFTPFELMVLRTFEWDRINFKTPEKVIKIAKLMNMSVNALNEHRKQTRIKCGVHF